MEGTNRVAVYHSNKDVRVEERPIPPILARELLVKVHASGICGSDVLEWYRVPKAPVVLGHEIAAEVVEAGTEVKEWKPADRVFVSHHVPCGECIYCKTGHETVCQTLRMTNFDPGGFAQYVRVPEVNVRHGVFRIPEGLSYDEATFIEPLGCAVRGQRAANLRAGQTVIVLGSGMAGLLHVRLAQAAGAAKIFATDVVPYRIEAAKAAGADGVWDAKDDVPERVKAFNGGRLADLVIVCTAAPPAVEQAFRCVEPGGTILFFAPTAPDATVSMPFNLLWRNEVTITSTYGAAPRDIREAVELLGKGKVKVKDLITHRLPLQEAGKGFSIVAEGKESIKVVLEPHA